MERKKDNLVKSVASAVNFMMADRDVNEFPIIRAQKKLKDHYDNKIVASDSMKKRIREELNHFRESGYYWQIAPKYLERTEDRTRFLEENHPEELEEETD